MPLFAHFKAQPTDYVFRYRNGTPVAEGLGLSFFYQPINTTVALIPVSNVDTAFAFQEQTASFQTVTVQGQFSYRIVDPKLAASQVNFSIDPRRGGYLTKEPERLANRISNVVQSATRAQVLARDLVETLRETQAMAVEVREAARASDELKYLGVELVALHIAAATPSPEVGRALEAEVREALLRRADEAVYARRAAAVEEERKIQEKELETQTALEEQRRQLIELAGENAKQEAANQAVAAEIGAASEAKTFEINAEARRAALEKELALYADLDPRILAALGFKLIGERGKVDQLTITTEVLSALLDDRRS